MEYDQKDNEVIHLLKKLKTSNGTYPPEMLALRRQGYLRQVAQVSSGVGLAVGLRNMAKGGKGAVLPPAAGTILEALLVIAIVAEAGAVTYFYREKLAEYFRSFTNSPKVEEVSSPEVLPSPLVEVEFTTTPVVLSTLTATGTGTSTATPVGTTTLEFAVQPTGQNGGSGGPAGTGVTSTGTGGRSNPTGPVVSTSEPNTNNGNQYGLTPKPERTKEPGNDVSSSNTQNSDKDPKQKP